MTEQELNVVRELSKRIRELERYLQALRLSAQNITPVIDGLPHSTTLQARVEKIALSIVEKERELYQLQEQFLHEQGRLAEFILSSVNDPTLQTLLILRYVACLSFKETARSMHFTLRHVFRLHEKFLKDVICLHIVAQNDI